MITILFKKLHPEATIPKYQTAGSVGLDLHALLIGENQRHQKLMLPPRTVRPCPTGLAFEIECIDNPLHYAQIVSRSGMTARYCLTVANAPGIIDLDYRGEIIVLLYNGGIETQWVQHGDRIAQMLIAPFTKPMITQIEELSETERGEKGFGSTGR